uniref:Uncharacterized protein n=1 Tax=Cacopsylla melanoneura TaxID=428564 RepID=A0A8D9B2R3_9HEMI
MNMVPLWSISFTALCSAIMKRVAESESPCFTPALISKGSLSMLSILTFALDFAMVIIARFISFVGISRLFMASFNLLRSILSKACLKSINKMFKSMSYS